jgi:uncharacterized protein (TIGR03435 family)
MALAAAAVVILAAAIGTAILWPRGDDALYRVVDGVVQAGGTIRTNGGGAQLALVDGSRVEMRSQSELSLERADDGLRIRLDKGGIIVNAAPQRSGHLYVQTKDVTVSVIGTVFLVNATEDGSRVAVIEGEVHVQQGVIEKRLLPGEQVATNPSMEARAVREAIAWSRNAAALVALLQQSTVAPAAIAAQNPPAPREAFEVASIRPTRFAAGGERGAGGGGPSSPRPAGEPCGSSGMTSFIQFDPGRVAINDMTLYGLITWAYEMPCRPWKGSHLLTGGPGWVRSDGYDIQAVIPPGPQAYTTIQLTAPGRTRQLFEPRFRSLLRTLLAERFRLTLRRETREVPVYVLTVAPGGSKLAAWKEGDPTTQYDLMSLLARNGTLLTEEQMSALGLTAAEVLDLHTRKQLEGTMMRRASAAGVRPLYGLADAKAPIASLVDQIDRTLDETIHRPVLDRTGLTGEFNFRVQYDRAVGPEAVGPSIFAALEKELGLRLTPATAPMEVTVIEGAERPTPN